jgi:hypothetical protein
MLDPHFSIVPITIDHHDVSDWQSIFWQADHEATLRISVRVVLFLSDYVRGSH